jgi:site-specific DNA-methyltransferase (adenine-specific)
LRDIATIRNNDWTNLEQYFNVPNPVRTIDYQKTSLKKSVIIPQELEYHSKEAEVETEKTVFFDILEIPQRKIAAYAAATNYSVYKDELKK